MQRVRGQTSHGTFDGSEILGDDSNHVPVIWMDGHLGSILDHAKWQSTLHALCLLLPPAARKGTRRDELLGNRGAAVICLAQVAPDTRPPSMPGRGVLPALQLPRWTATACFLAGLPRSCLSLADPRVFETQETGDRQSYWATVPWRLEADRGDGLVSSRSTLSLVVGFFAGPFVDGSRAGRIRVRIQRAHPEHWQRGKEPPCLSCQCLSRPSGHAIGAADKGVKFPNSMCCIYSIPSVYVMIGLIICT